MTHTTASTPETKSNVIGAIDWPMKVRMSSPMQKANSAVMLSTLQNVSLTPNGGIVAARAAERSSTSPWLLFNVPKVGRMVGRMQLSSANSRIIQ